MTWITKPIGAFCRTGSGGTPSRQQESRFYGGSIPWVKSGELKESIVFETEETITEAALAESSAKIIPPGALLVAMYGATVGRIAILGIEAASNQAVCHIVPNESAADQRYLFYALRTQIPRWLEQRVGGAQPNISQQIIRDTQIPLPPLEEQRRIAAILDKADAVRRKRQQAIALTEELLRSAFLEMFGDPVTNPKGWNSVNLRSQIAELRYGTSVKCDDIKANAALPILRIPNIVGEQISWNDLKYAELEAKEVTKLLLKPGDLLFVRTNGNPEYIGRCALFEEGYSNALYASYLIRARLKSNARLYPAFIRDIISFPTYRSHLVREARTTAGNYNINTEGLGWLY